MPKHQTSRLAGVVVKTVRNERVRKGERNTSRLLGVGKPEGNTVEKH